MWKCLCACVALALSVSPLWAIAPGTVDTFEDGTFQEWFGGPAENVATGGPAGADDRFLRVASGTFGFRSRLAIYNSEVRWVGDYTAAGVTRIEADLKILGGPALSMRVVLFGGDNFSRMTTTTAQPLPADGQWHHLVWNITAADFTVVDGLDPRANILTSVNRMMIRHESGPPMAGGTIVSANVGFDNIKAGPEPVTISQWRSVLTHTGPVSLPIVLDADAAGDGVSGPTTESRSDGLQRIEVDFSGPVSLTSAAVSVIGQTTSGGVPDAPVPYTPTSVSMVDADTAAIAFAPGQLPDRTCYTIDISPGILTGLAGDHDVKVRALKGDSTMSGGITLSDAILITARVTELPSANPQVDVDQNGVIHINDALSAKAAIGGQALCP